MMSDKKPAGLLCHVGDVEAAEQSQIEQLKFEIQTPPSSLTRRDILRGALATVSMTMLPELTAQIASDQRAAITDVAGIKVGHYTDPRRPTGVTVILTEEGATPGVDVRGAAPGTR